MGELVTKTISNLLTYHFNIPSYQRGYRWDNQQVNDLLDDLLEYSDNKNGDYYCLQPVVVFKNIKLTKEKKLDIYDLIDGQQRLTTLFLLLTYLEPQRKILYEDDYEKIWSLDFEQRDDGFLNLEKFKDENSHEYTKDINYFYIKKAYTSISNWFNNHPKTKNKILNTIFGQTGTEDKNVVKVIWYELSDKDEKPLEVFKRLNHGKIPLTDAELIKALLLECDSYKEPIIRKKREEIAFRISCEWDEIEKKLNDPFFWNFLSASTYNPSSRISFVLHKVARDIKKNSDIKKREECKKEKKDFKSDYDFSEDKDFFDYHIANSFLKYRVGEGIEYPIDELWELIQDAFTVFTNWYSDRKIYHLIGYLIAIIDFENNRKPKQYQKKTEELIDELFSYYKRYYKTDFYNYLYSKVQETLKRINDDTFGSLNYFENSHDMVRILLLANVDYLIEHPLEHSLYPFGKQKEQNITSLEHIHPQNLDIEIKGEREDYEIVCPWLLSKKQYLLFLQNIPKEIINSIDYFTNSFENYQNNWEKCRELVNQVDNIFCDYANLSSVEMHTLRNMALINKDVNSALSNDFLDKKRNILYRKEEEEGYYIPPLTKIVFNKSLSKEVASLIFWEKDDRDTYFNYLLSIYKKYTSPYEV